MEHLHQKSKCSIIHNIFKCMIFKDIKMGLYEVKGSKEAAQARLSLFMSKSHIVGNLMPHLKYTTFRPKIKNCVF